MLRVIRDRRAEVAVVLSKREQTKTLPRASTALAAARLRS
jgi:hypothetical protein